MGAGTRPTTQGRRPVLASWRDACITPGRQAGCASDDIEVVLGWTLDDPRDELIRTRFACTPEAFARELAALVDSSDALAHDPLVVHRLRRRQDRARRARYQEVAR